VRAAAGEQRERRERADATRAASPNAARLSVHGGEW
jgi:hypothetical protein